MHCCVTDLRNKDVICRSDGKRIGSICDVDIDTCTGQVVAVVIFGRGRWFGLLGHEEDIRIRWEDIEVIGDDTIIVSRRPSCKSPRGGRYRNHGKEY
ncbi:MAG: YlmC/YmxH family sporulation protein [Clostridia bacterium]|nr:YlmC/YmxH family sporulation protein [Clostridia bacterium]